MQRLKATCSNRPRTPLANDHSKGHQWWLREVYHLRLAGAQRTLCGVDCSEWLDMEMPPELGSDCCIKCAKKA